MTSNRGRRALFRIAPADAMNPAAANSLLKTLEEPASAALLLLVSASPGALPATVRSRCQPVTLAAPPADVALPWLRAQLPSGAPAEQLLAVARGAPLRALDLAAEGKLERRERCLSELRQVGGGDADPIAVANAWQSEDAGLLLSWLAGWVSDCLRLLADPHAPHLTNPDQRQPLAELSRRLRPEPGHRFLEQVLAARAQAGSTVNKQLLFEALLLRWAHLTRQQTAPH
jgi:DNA polymerase-3 subunit delta'